MRRVLILALLLPLSQLWAQGGAGGRQRVPARGVEDQGLSDDLQQGNPQARQRLLQQITERFMENYRQTAGLTPDQNQKFRAIAQRSFEQRRERQQRERQLFQALEAQMRPGVAANADSVTRLLDAIVASREATVEQARNDQKDFAAFLSPVQRAQLFLQFERLQRNIEDLIQRRMQRMQGGGAGGGAGLEPQD